MKGEFCPMCGARRLTRSRRDVRLEKRQRNVKGIYVWRCESCNEEFLDDSSLERVYGASRKAATKAATAR